ncbi:SEC14 domain and spectrin repeat-containing protein 1-B-like [Tropilaelaps mercedesae]|uniref:SEC14 domain and spectrin repeat-containing protein 1-B-like n=1 Tax=Tropilaelaps mercedesae TaxID=418985 RepID=A0A1V9Y1L4_9ACAR|nr:SEC14 domain and spectrin repeat-containing protein 1-B-like [Tropilaelaps mercedesae]
MLSLGERLKRVGSLGPIGAAGHSKSSTEKEKLASSGFYQQEIYSNPGPGATEIVELLRRRLAVLSGGEDKHGGPIVTVFAPKDDFRTNDLKQTLHFLKDLIGEEERSIGVSVLLEGSPVLTRCFDDVIGAVQNVFGDCLHAIYVFAAHGLWHHKSRSSPDIRKALQDSSGASLSYMTQQKLFKVISPFQLTNEFGGTLEYNHLAWLERQLAIEKFLRDARIIRKHADAIIQTCEARLEAEGPTPASVEDIQKNCASMASVIHTTLGNGQRLLLGLQSETEGSLSQCGKGALKQNASQLRNIKIVLDSVASVKAVFDVRWTALHGALCQISHMQRFVQESAEIMAWIESEGERLLIEGAPLVGETLEEAVLRRKHMHQVALLSMDCYARYSQLKNLAQHLLRESNTDTAVVKSTVQKLDAICQVFATKVDAQRRVSELAVVFHQTCEQTSKLAKDIERRVCAGNSSCVSAGDPIGSTGDSACDSSNSDGYSIVDEDDALVGGELHQGLGHLCGHSTQEAHKAILELDDTASVLNSSLDDFKRVSIAFEKSLQNPDFETAQPMVERMSAVVNKNIDSVKALIEVKRNHLVQTVQLLSCEQDAKQSVTWLDDLCLAAQHSLESDSGIEEQTSRLKHEKMDTTAKETYEYGRRLLDSAVKLRKNCKYITSPSTRIADQLFNAWLRYLNVTKGGRVSGSQTSSTAGSSPSSSPVTSKMPFGKTLSNSSGCTNSTQTPSAYRHHKRSSFLPPIPVNSNNTIQRQLRSFHSCSSLV